MRSSKTNGTLTTEYLYDDDRLIREKRGTDTIWYTYDQNGEMIGFELNHATNYYQYVRNLAGDVVKVIGAGSGLTYTTYSYDAWGKCTIVTNGSNIANINPIRYRGYYYDSETGFYYLNSRYYDPETGRFISPDVIVENGSLYAYCGNDPINFYDPSGYGSMFKGKFWDKARAITNKLNAVARSIAGFVMDTVDSVVAAIKPVVDVLENIVEDIKSFDINNTDPSKVHAANYFSGFGGQIVIHAQWKGNGRSGSFGRFLYLDRLDKGNTNTLLHESGHYIQYKELGLIRYTFGIAIPSIRNGSVSPYYDQKWEITADIFGGVTGRTYASGSVSAGWNYYGGLKSKAIPVIIYECFKYYW